jgi:hypothetical protein
VSTYDWLKDPVKVAKAAEAFQKNSVRMEKSMIFSCFRAQRSDLNKFESKQVEEERKASIARFEAEFDNERIRKLHIENYITQL